MDNPVSLIPDIEDTIFEWSAWLFPGQASCLTVISKRVQKVVERIIYESILFAWEENYGLPNDVTVVSDLSKFKFTIHARPDEFWTSHVRNVFSPYYVREVKLLLARCSQLVNVTWQWRHILDKGAPFLLPSAASLSSLSITRHGLMEVAALGVTFINLKYVELSEGELSLRLPPLSWAPALSALRIGVPASCISLQENGVQMVMEDIQTLACAHLDTLTTLTLVIDDDFRNAIRGEVEALDVVPFAIYFESRRVGDFHFYLAVRWLWRFWSP
ncbi:hypothetical protein H0H93_012201 [Arthromyces matolae]|nr:hypothetical protein H0H93_012201 [Arthromyces matolae]